MLRRDEYHERHPRQKSIYPGGAAPFVIQDHDVHLPMRLTDAVPGATSTATSTQRRLGVATLLVNTGLMNFGFSVLIPLLAVHYTGQLGFTAASIGLVLGLRQFSQQGLDLVGGLIGDRFGARVTISVGCFVRAAGFFGIGFAHSLGQLIVFAVVSGIGGAFFDAPSTAALADLVDADRRQRVFAASATFGNLGVTLGPLVGVALLGVGFQAVTIAAAACFVLVGLLAFAFVPASALAGRRGAIAARLSANTRSDATHDVPAFAAIMRALATDRTFVLFTLFLAGFWFLWAQMNISVPLAADRLGGPHFVALAFAINAGPAVLCQYPLARYVGERFAPRWTLAIALAICAAGIALAFTEPVAGVLFLGIALFALARMVIGPVVNAVTADLAPSGMLGAYFGFGALAVALGAGIGQFAGGALYDLALAHHAAIALWLPLLALGLAAAYGLLRLPLPVQSAPGVQRRTLVKPPRTIDTWMPGRAATNTGSMPTVE